MLQRLGVSAWLGFALAALFFYSLAVTLDSDILYLLWRSIDVAETLTALLLLAVVFAIVIYAVWPRNDRTALLALLAIATLPLASFLAGVARQLPFDEALRAMGENRAIGFTVAAILVAALAAGVAVWPGH